MHNWSSCTEQDKAVPPFGHHRFGAGTSQHWDILAPVVMVPDVSALALYAVAAASAGNVTQRY